jgi:hypothetical protein
MKCRPLPAGVCELLINQDALTNDCLGVLLCYTADRAVLVIRACAMRGRP